MKSKSTITKHQKRPGYAKPRKPDIGNDVAKVSKDNSRSNNPSSTNRIEVAALSSESSSKIIDSKLRGTKTNENRGNSSKLITGEMMDIVAKLAAVAGNINTLKNTCK